MNKVKLFIFIFLVLVLQLTFLRKVKIYNAQPDLLFLTTIYFGLFRGFSLGFLVGLGCGFLADIFSINPFGVNTFLFALTGLAMAFLSDRLYKNSPLMQVSLVFTACLISGLFFNLLSKTLPGSFFNFFWLLMILPGSFYTGLVAPFFIFILNKLFKPLSV